MMIRKIISILVVFLCISCEKMLLGEEYLFIRHKNVDMPLWVRGNTESDVFIVYLHGGPGGSSFIDIQNNFFGKIERHFAMVYYDQRASGNSIGRSDKSLLTLDQFVEDLDVIIQYIQQKHDPSKIILMGHSWGGTLGTAYLLNDENQSKIDAWIEIDGGHNLGQNAYEYSRDYVLQYSKSQYMNAPEKEKKEWCEIIDYYDGINNWRNTDVIIQHSKNVTKVHGYFYDQKKREGLVGLEQVLFSETDFLALLSQNYNVIENMDVWHYDYTNRLNEIKIPTLLLWGLRDGILPVQLAYEAKDALQLEDDCFYVFQKSGHSPHYEQTELFNQKVLEFLSTKVGGVSLE